MPVISRKDLSKGTDIPKRRIDSQKILLDGAIAEKDNIKRTPLSRLHGIKTEVVYYEQIISNRRDNLSNNASLNQFDPNIAKFRKITNFTLLTEEIDSQIDRDVFTNLTYEGLAKILPNTVIPNANDFFIMNVFGVYHLFRINEINPSLIEKDSGYEIRYKIYRQNIIPENCELNTNVRESYTFDYNHVGTDFRTVLKTDENEFIQNSREIMYTLMTNYAEIFYHRTFNTFMVESKRFSTEILNILDTAFSEGKLPMIGSVIVENVSMYDVPLIYFINKYDLTSPNEYIHSLTQYIKPNKKFYNNSIFSAIETMKIERFVNDKQLIVYSNSNPYYNTNRL